MPRFDETTLEKRATAVVDRFLREKVALTDGVVAAAQEENLNPEQLKRLVEAVNNMAFLKKFEGAPDRMNASEFEPASADAALQQLVDQAGAESDGAELPGQPTAVDNGSNGQNSGINTADDLVAALPMTRPGESPLPPPTQQPPPAESPVSGAKMAMRLEKTAEQLRDARLQAQYRFTDEFQRLATYFTRSDAPPFEAFEQDALYKWGAVAIPHLGALRAVLRKSPAEYDPTVNTKVARIIDSRTPAMGSFQALLEEADKMVKAAHGEQRAREYQTRASTMVR
jgi:hypothetical protein